MGSWETGRLADGCRYDVGSDDLRDLRLGADRLRIGTVSLLALYSYEVDAPVSKIESSKAYSNCIPLTTEDSEAGPFSCRGSHSEGLQGQ